MSDQGSKKSPFPEVRPPMPIEMAFQWYKQRADEAEQREAYLRQQTQWDRLLSNNVP